MSKGRLDQALVRRGLVATRSQAESYIKLGYVTVNGSAVTKPGYMVDDTASIKLSVAQQYVSRAALKLASVADELQLDFKDHVVLDVGSSTGGFTDFALRQGARKVIAVDVGTNQMHPTLRDNPKIELHEQTDIRDLKTTSESPDLVVIDVSFISIRQVLPAVSRLSTKGTRVIAMVKPQFEIGDDAKHKGVVKNDRMRRDTLKQFELWAQESFIMLNKSDSAVSGEKGNQERFYLLKKK